MALTLADRPVRLLTADEVLRMVDAGIIDDGERVELLHGVLTEVNAQSPEHAELVSRLFAWLGAGATAGRYVVRPGSPIIVPDRFSLPEPDIAVIEPRGGAIRPHPDAALLLIEVSFSSLRIDLRLKRDLYAEAAVPEYWVLDVAGRRLVCLTDPVDGHFETERVLVAGDSARPAEVDVEPLDLRSLFAGLDDA